jgi:hypothetical protein
MISGYISGGTSECLFALPLVRALGIRRLYLNVDPRYRLRYVGTEVFTEAAVRSLEPLLRSQPYLEETRLYGGEQVHYRLDLFRYAGDLIYQNLARSMLQTFGGDPEVLAAPWLYARPDRRERTVLIHRNDRHPSPEVRWNTLLGRYGGELAFVGAPADYQSFIEEIPGGCEVPFYGASDLLECARLIAGCRVFIGSQGPEHALAEGLKKDLIQAVCPEHPNSIFRRPGATYLPDRYMLGGLP